MDTPRTLAAQAEINKTLAETTKKNAETIAKVEEGLRAYHEEMIKHAAHGDGAH